MWKNSCKWKTTWKSNKKQQENTNSLGDFFFFFLGGRNTCTLTYKQDLYERTHINERQPDRATKNNKRTLTLLETWGGGGIHELFFCKQDLYERTHLNERQPDRATKNNNRSLTLLETWCVSHTVGHFIMRFQRFQAVKSSLRFLPNQEIFHCHEKNSVHNFAHGYANHTWCKRNAPNRENEEQVIRDTVVCEVFFFFSPLSIF